MKPTFCFRHMLTALQELRTYLLLWFTQSISQLGSAMTSFALVIWLYQGTQSALETALLAVSSYVPYVVMSVFAGALCDRWNKKATMLACDTIAALTSVAVLMLLRMNLLEPWHLYIINALSGLMNTVQQPASDVATTLLIPRKHYQRTSALRSLSGSVITLLQPVLATAVLALGGLEMVITIDLCTFGIAFVTLLSFISIPDRKAENAQQEPLLQSVKAGLRFLRQHPGIFWLILYLAAINLIASIYDAARPAYLLSCTNGGEAVLGLVSSITGAAMLLGSVLAAMMPKPKNRVRVICLTLLISLGTENFLLAFGREPWMWCVGAVMGWLLIPLMNANLDVIMRSSIPVEMQGRVYACRNTFQYFTIPIGFFLGGWLIDVVFEPLMASLPASSMLHTLFGQGMGSGAAMLFMCIGVAGVLICVTFPLNKHIRELANQV